MTELSDEQRLAVLAELWAEQEAGPKWVPLYLAVQRYEQRVRAGVATSRKQLTLRPKSGR